MRTALIQQPCGCCMITWVPVNNLVLLAPNRSLTARFSGNGGRCYKLFSHQFTWRWVLLVKGSGETLQQKALFFLVSWCFRGVWPPCMQEVLVFSLQQTFVARTSQSFLPSALCLLTAWQGFFLLTSHSLRSMLTKISLWTVGLLCPRPIPWPCLLWSRV